MTKKKLIAELVVSFKVIDADARQIGDFARKGSGGLHDQCQDSKSRDETNMLTTESNRRGRERSLRR